MWPWAAAFVGATMGAQWFSQAFGGAVFLRSSYLAGAWWQLLSGQWVHVNYSHALVNAVGMVVVLLTLHGWVGARLQVLALLGGYAGVATVLALDPQCLAYAGASGALHGLLAGGALGILRPGLEPDADQQRRGNGLAMVLLLGLAIKLLVQHLVGNPMEPGWLGFATYYSAHEAGAVGGLAMVLVGLGLGRPAHAHAEQQED